jgi:hypothetical protein
MVVSPTKLGILVTRTFGIKSSGKWIDGGTKNAYIGLKLLALFPEGSFLGPLAIGGLK